MNKALFINPQTIKSEGDIDNNTDKVRQSLVLAQDINLQPLLGTALFNKMSTDIVNGTESLLYKQLRENYIWNVLIYYTKANLIMKSYRITDDGAVKSSSKVLPKSDLSSLHSSAIGNAEFYADLLTEFLIDNSSSYPEFSESVNVGLNAYNSESEGGWFFEQDIFTNRGNSSSMF